jgi:hypothetical protein
MEVAMQKRHIILVVAVLAVGLLTKQLLWPAKPADANPQATGVDVLQMQQDDNAKNIPAQNVDDKSFVFGSTDRENLPADR